MQLIQPQGNHLVEMMSWFNTKQALEDWSGPGFSYPFDLSSFTEDLKLKTLNSFVLISSTSEFLGFGQFYQRLNKCHLARLIVNPKLRGRGIAAQLMTSLCDLGCEQLKLNACSLFVLAHNESAIKSYTKFGFAITDYPYDIPLSNCLYMVK